MAADAPDTPDDEASEAELPTVRVVQFRIGDRRYALPVSAVDTIVERPNATRVPRAPDAIEGVFDLRGEITAVVDPAAHFDVGQAGTVEDQHRVLVFDGAADDQAVGMRVDEVIGVVPVPETRIDLEVDEPELATTALEHELITGAIREPEDDSFDLVPIVDAPAIVAASRE